eukprot:PhF_6_TR28293/c0_g1_i2/m.41900
MTFERRTILPYLHTIHLAIGFLILFIAFNAAQTMESSLHAELGTTSLAIVYAFYAFASLFLATPVVLRIGPRNGLIVGSCTYGLYLAANVYATAWTMYPFSAVLGFGAAILWVSQGVYLTSCCSDLSHSGKHSGVFFAISQINLVLGNLLSSSVLHHFNAYVLFVILTLIAFSSIGVFALLPNKRPPNDQTPAALQNDITMSFAPPPPGTAWNVLPIIRSTLQTIVTAPVIRRALLVYLWSGWSIGLYLAYFTGYWVEPYYGQSNVGYVMVAFGLTDMIASATIGLAMDRFGRSICVGFTSCCVLSGLGMMEVRIGNQSVAAIELFFVAALFGIGDAGYNTVIQSIISAKERDHSTEAFAALRTIQSAVSTISIAIAPHMGQRPMVIISFVLVLVAWIAFLYTERNGKVVVVKQQEHYHEETNVLELDPLGV